MATSIVKEEVGSSREALEFLELWEFVESSSSLSGGEALRWVERVVNAVCKGLGLLVLEEDGTRVSLEEVLESSVALETAGIC
jgi:hypothetical protein